MEFLVEMDVVVVDEDQYGRKYMKLLDGSN
jgi:hypothetical protein